MDITWHYGISKSNIRTGGYDNLPGHGYLLFLNRNATLSNENSMHTQMKNKFFIVLSIYFFAIISQKSFGQKKLINEYDNVVAEAKSELDSLLSPGGMLQIEAAKKKLTGEFTMDVTIYEKGKVLSLFMVSAKTEDIKMKNLAKDLVQSVLFNFKMPREKNYKFQYTFIFK
jgi:hypothetical protein